MTDQRHSGEPETPQAGWVERLTALLHETRQHHGPPCDLCVTTANGFRRQAEREAAAAPGAGLDVDRLFAVLWTTDAFWHFSNDKQPNERQRFRDWAARIAAEYQRLGATPDPGPT